MDTLKIYCDGGARGNPGPAASAFVALDGSNVVFKKGKFLGRATNNIAEYNSALLALRWLLANEDQHKGLNEVLVHLDSQLIVNQLTGVFKIKDQKLLALAMKIKDLEQLLSYPVKYKNIPREQNRIADFLVNETLDKKQNP